MAQSIETLTNGEMRLLQICRNNGIELMQGTNTTPESDNSGINWRGWIITKEQAEKIKKLDINAMTEFYINNSLRIEKMAWRFCKRKWFANLARYTIADCMQQVFADLPLYRYSSGLVISYDVTSSFEGSICGGYSSARGFEFRKKLYRLGGISTEEYSKSKNDSGNQSDKFYYQKRCQNVKSAEEEYFAVIDDNTTAMETALIDFIMHTVRSETARKVLEYRLFSDLSYSEIAEELGLKNINSRHYYQKLILNYEKLLECLELVGSEKVVYYLGLEPPKYRHIKEVTEAREKRNCEKIKAKNLKKRELEEFIAGIGEIAPAAIEQYI